MLSNSRSEAAFTKKHSGTVLECPKSTADVVIRHSSKKAGLSTFTRSPNHGQYHPYAQAEGRCLMPAYGELPRYDSLRGLTRVPKS